jgi:hydroxyacylglutathione hydrolase
MGIRHPIITQISKDTFHINEFGISNMYVLRGSERSLIIDSGTGYCDFKAIIESLTDKPYDVAITHGHPDHVGMIHQFDEVYMNVKDIPLMEETFSEPLGIDAFRKNNRVHVGEDWQAWEVTEDMINRGNKNTKIIPLEDGHIFDLGNRKVSSYALAGHTSGGMYFVDDYSRIVFAGDCCHQDHACRNVPVSTALRGLIKLYDKFGKDYDRMFTGHTAFCGTLNVRSTNMEILRNLIEAYRALLRGEAKFGSYQHYLSSEPHTVIVYGPDSEYFFDNVPGPMILAGFTEGLLWEEGEDPIIP